MSMLLLLVSLSAFGEPASVKPVACQSIKVGQKIEITESTDPTFDLDSAKRSPRAAKATQYTEHDILHPMTLKRVHLPDNAHAEVLRDGFVSVEDAGGLQYVSCNLVVEIDGKHVLVRKMRYGNNPKLLHQYAENLSNVRVLSPNHDASPELIPSANLENSDLSNARSDK